MKTLLIMSSIFVFMVGCKTVGGSDSRVKNEITIPRIELSESEKMAVAEIIWAFYPKFFPEGTKDVNSEFYEKFSRQLTHETTDNVYTRFRQLLAEQSVENDQLEVFVVQEIATRTNLIDILAGIQQPPAKVL